MAIPTTHLLKTQAIRIKWGRNIKKGSEYSFPSMFIQMRWLGFFHLSNWWMVFCFKTPRVAKVDLHRWWSIFSRNVQLKILQQYIYLFCGEEDEHEISIEKSALFCVWKIIVLFQVSSIIVMQMLGYVELYILSRTWIIIIEMTWTASPAPIIISSCLFRRAPGLWNFEGSPKVTLIHSPYSK